MLLGLALEPRVMTAVLRSCLLAIKNGAGRRFVDVQYVTVLIWQRAEPDDLRVITVSVLSR